MSRFRRVLWWLPLISVLLAPALACAEEGVQSLEAIRAAAQSFVLQQVPKQAPGTMQVNVGALDPRLRLAACADPLKASL
ncbi:MAG: flagellar basal body P-ring formation protein FlgA, partial [Gammaproteobacteria bacterium]